MTTSTPPPLPSGSGAPAATDAHLGTQNRFAPLRFALAMMGAIPLQLGAVAAGREAIPFLVDYWLSLQPPYDDSGGVLPPSPAELLGVLIRFVGLALAITVAYRVMLNFYDARYPQRAVPNHSGARQPARIVVSGAIRTAGWLIVFGIIGLMIWGWFPPGTGDEKNLDRAVVLITVFLASMKFGFVFVAAADGRKSSLKRSFRVLDGRRWRDLLVTNAVLFAVIIAVSVSSASWIETPQRSAWLEYLIAVARTFLLVGIVGGATTYMYRSAFPPGSVTPMVNGLAQESLE